MKFTHLLITTLLACAGTAHAGEMTFSNAKGNFLKVIIPVEDYSKSVGQLSLEALTNAQNKKVLAFEATANGITSIGTDVTKTDVYGPGLVVASGWCFALNGKNPNAMPGNVFLKNQSDKVEWYYGYMVYKNGAWGKKCHRAQSVNLR